MCCFSLGGTIYARLSLPNELTRHVRCLVFGNPIDFPPASIPSPASSGLDSFAALSVMSYLQQLAQSAQQTVIATIHQPRSDIWEMFDTVSV